MSSRITITAVTQKMGAVPSVSLEPRLTCSAALPCWPHCYARRFLMFRPTMRKAWSDNTRAMIEERDRFFLAVRGSLAADNPPFFRWHVGGDIPDQDYFDRLFKVACEFPDTRFLVFTKKLNLRLRRRENLNVFASFWPGWGDLAAVRRQGLPVAWVQDGTENRMPRGVKRCAGSCSSCHFCWVTEPVRDVCFHKH